MNLIHHAEWKSPTDAVYTCARYDPSRSLWGTRIAWHCFELSEPALLFASGGVHIRHRGIPVLCNKIIYGVNGNNPFSQTVQLTHDSYPIYGNARIIIHEAATVQQLPESGGVGGNNILRLHGVNVDGVTDHYAALVPVAQVMLSAGAKRVELWAGAGSDAADGSDSLAEIFDAGGILAQFNVLVFA